MYVCTCMYVCMYVHRDLLAIWGKYLLESLPDPGDQLCTDDFEGPSPHNVNLAAKVCSVQCTVHACLET